MGKCKAIKFAPQRSLVLGGQAPSSMFKAYYSNDGFCGDPLIEDGHHLYSYWIVDDNFAEDWFGPSRQRLNHSIVRCGAIIQCYESKGLNVAFNLCLYHRWMDETYHWYKLEDEINYNIQQTPMYGEYAPLVKQYLNRFNSLKVFW